MSKRLPLNSKVIVFDYAGVNTGRFGVGGKYVSWLEIEDYCRNRKCPNSDEHISFDGQIFYFNKPSKRVVNG